MDNDKILQEEGEVILPITHEACVLNDAGQPITETIGNISNLYTKEKTLVGAVNEVYTSSLKQQMVEILLDKGIDCNINMTFVEILDLFRGINISDGIGLDIIAATELPATGNNMQLCAITNNITDSFILSNDEADVIISNDKTIGLHLTDLTMYEKYSYPIGGSLINLRIASAHQNASAIPLWLYYNNAWKQICFNSLFIIRAMLLQNGFMISNTGSLCNYNSSKGISILPGDQHTLIGYTPFKEPVDFSKYRAIRIKGTYKNTYESSGTFGPGIGIFGRTSNINDGIETGIGFGLTDIGSVFEGEFARSTDFTTNVTTSTPFDITFNVSGINTQYYLGIATAFTEYTYITDIELIMN